MCKFIDILDKVNPEHRVRFVGWSSDFIENETWPSVLEFRVYKTCTDANSIVNVILTEGDDVTWDAGSLQLYYKDWIKDANGIKFFFNDCEVIPSFGDVGHSDKITHINFEPKNV